MKGIYPLQGAVKNYDWGGTTYISNLLQQENNAQLPQAEYWLGVHPLGDALVTDGSGQKLSALINSNPGSLLGSAAMAHFGHLPFLLKVLDVEKMLSIQVHPSKAGAEEGFARENAAGIPANAPHRNYKDDNHKPELSVALTEFWLLHGFKTSAAIRSTLESMPGWHSLLEQFDSGGTPALYRYIMELPQPEVDRLLQPLLEKIQPDYNAGILLKSDPAFWAARAAETYPGPADRGIFSIYLFNLLKLEPGQAIFQDAGIPHAYLEGKAVEIMANSDTVLRGGLTPKHIDIAELLLHTRTEPVIPQVLTGEERSSVEKVFTTPAPDFELSVFHIAQNQPVSFNTSGAEIILVMEGATDVMVEPDTIRLQRGGAAFIAANRHVTLNPVEKLVLFRAAIPVDK